MADYNNLKPIDLNKIEFVDFPKDHYFKEEWPKSVICLHHTVSNPNSIEGDLRTWLSKPSHVATCILISGDGTPHQCFSSKYWAYHLGLQTSVFKENDVPYKSIDKISIGIEIDNWGGLLLGDGKTIKNFGTEEAPRMVRLEEGKYYAAYGNVVNVDENKLSYYEFGFRGYKYFMNYTQQQINTVGELLLFWNKRYGIPLTYNEDMWDVSKKALSGEPGIWAHVSYRYDKSDIHPDIKMIKMLKSL